MATINYILKSTKNPSTLYVRFRSGRTIDIITSTKFHINPVHWSKVKQKMKGIVEQNGSIRYETINKYLKNLKEHIIDQYNQDYAEGEIIDKKWLDETIIKLFNRPSKGDTDINVFFIPFVKKFIEEAPTTIRRKTNKPVSNETIKEYKSTLTKLNDFETHIEKRIKYKDLNLTFHQQFLDFLKNEQNLGLKTIGNYIKTVKAFARQAKLKGHPVHDEIDHPEFFSPDSKTKAIYLNEVEIDKIYQHDFSNNERLDRVRDLFIIGLWTGLRISDFSRVSESHIKDGKFFQIESQKTGQKPLIPIHPHILSILKKREGKFPESISDQKFNEYVKEVGKEIGLNQMIEGAKINPETKRKEEGIFPKYELITSHICRRSFATNHYGKLPNQTIMAITGHRSEKQFLDYIQITPKEHAEKMEEFWWNQTKENEQEELKLKVVR